MFIFLIQFYTHLNFIFISWLRRTCFKFEFLKTRALATGKSLAPINAKSGEWGKMKKNWRRKSINKLVFTESPSVGLTSKQTLWTRLIICLYVFIMRPILNIDYQGTGHRAEHQIKHFSYKKMSKYKTLHRFNLPSFSSSPSRCAKFLLLYYPWWCHFFAHLKKLTPLLTPSPPALYLLFPLLFYLTL